MLQFMVDDLQPVSSTSCQACCCDKLSLQPGTTSRMSVGYATWAVPIGQLHCSPQFQIEAMETCTMPANGGPVLTEQPHYDVEVDTPLPESLADWIETSGNPLAFKGLSLYGPKYGTVTIASSGDFTYTPSPQYTGADRFFASVTDGINPPLIFEVLIGVAVDSTTIKPTPHVSIGQASVDQQYYMVNFPVTISPAAQLCEIWRLTVLQAALDCDCQCYNRTDCFDIGIAKC
jgi:hypothetical protein